MNRPFSKNTNQKERKSIKSTKDIKEGTNPIKHRLQKIGKEKDFSKFGKRRPTLMIPYAQCTFWPLMSNNPGVSKFIKER